FTVTVGENQGAVMRCATSPDQGVLNIQNGSKLKPLIEDLLAGAIPAIYPRSVGGTAHRWRATAAARRKERDKRDVGVLYGLLRVRAPKCRGGLHLASTDVARAT